MHFLLGSAPKCASQLATLPVLIYFSPACAKIFAPTVTDTQEDIERLPFSRSCWTSVSQYAVTATRKATLTTSGAIPLPLLGRRRCLDFSCSVAFLAPQTTLCSFPGLSVPHSSPGMPFLAFFRGDATPTSLSPQDLGSGARPPLTHSPPR